MSDASSLNVEESKVWFDEFIKGIVERINQRFVERQDEAFAQSVYAFLREQIPEAFSDDVVRFDASDLNSTLRAPYLESLPVDRDRFYANLVFAALEWQI